MMRHLQVFLIATLALLCLSANAQEIKVESFTERTFDLEARSTGTKRLDNNGKACALIKVQIPVAKAEFEGNKVGDVIETPGEFKVYLVAGSRKLTIKVAGYMPCEVSFADYDIDGVKEEVVYRLTLKPESLAPKTQLVQIHVTPNNATVVLNDEPLTLSDGTASKTLPLGTYKYRVEAEGYETQEGQISNYDSERPTTVTFVLKKLPSKPGYGQPNPSTNQEEQPADHKIHPSSFYIEGKFQAGMMMGAGASVGTYIKNFNIEGTFLLGLAESEEIAWINKKQTTNTGYTYTYKPMFYGIKLGYGIPCGQSFRITPQVGVGVSSISGSQVKAGSGTDPDATSCYAVPASVGARFEYYFTEKFGLSASPEFGFAVMKSDTYTKLSDLSSKVKGFGSGFNARVGIFVSF